MNPLCSFKKTKAYTRTGFSLIELVVVIGILTVITAVTLTSYNKFGGTVILRNMTYDLALTVREAQVFGITGKHQNTDQFSSVPIAVMFTRGSSDFQMFADYDNDGVLDLTPVFEGFEDYSLGGGFTVSDIKGDGHTISKITIRFKRPEPDAIMKHPDTGAVYSTVDITVHSPKGRELGVRVGASGQISVKR